ncbi:MAG: polysaccharide pyruvyl transferase family protein, partial [Acidobacteriota bacterium]
YIGWLGHGNLGDEVMFAAIRSLLPGCDLIPFGGVRKERLLANQCLSGRQMFDAIILGGGTLINPGYVPVVRLAADRGVPLYAFGTGVGSCGFSEESNPALDGWADLLKRFRAVGVRGPHSKDALDELGVPAVRVIGDPALSLAPAELPPPPPRPRLAVNLALPASGRYGEGEYACYRQVAAIARKFRQDGGDVVGVALGDGDEQALWRFAADAGVPPACTVRCRRAGEFFQAVGGAVALIGVRLHSAVLAACVGVPAMLLSYRAKCLDFMASMDLGQFAVPLAPGCDDRVRSCFETLRGSPGLRLTMLERAAALRSEQRRLAARVGGDVAGLERLAVARSE